MKWTETLESKETMPRELEDLGNTFKYYPKSFHCSAKRIIENK